MKLPFLLLPGNTDREGELGADRVTCEYQEQWRW